MEKKKYHHGDLKQALIESGMKILKEEGVNALTLRSAARSAGVSHSAPYSHFKDKQALLAAISTMGFNDLYDRISTTISEFRNSPRDLLTETGWTYVQFAVSEPNCFKLMFSGILEDEHSYPEFMTAVQKTYHNLVEVVDICQKGKVLRSTPLEESAIAVWSMVHGFVSLYLEQQLPGRVLGKYQLKKLLIKTILHLDSGLITKI
jgi:AcrR family transcriptional regulator